MNFPLWLSMTYCSSTWTAIPLKDLAVRSHQAPAVRQSSPAMAAQQG